MPSKCVFLCTELDLEAVHVSPYPVLKKKLFIFNWASLVAQTVNNLPAVQEIQVRLLGWEDPLEKEMAIHSSILAWKIPWTGESGGLQSLGLQELDTT